jgi:hypothetical protein
MRKLALVALLAACGGSDPKQPVVIIDAPIDTTADSPPAQPTAIQIDVFGATPALVAYRDGAGSWQTASAGSNGRYIVNATADYQVVVACHDDTSAFSELLEATVVDGNQFVFCSVAGASTPPATVAMTGHMVQAGDVTFGDVASSTTAPWDFTLNVIPGMHDLIATSAAHGMVIRRDQNVTNAGAIPSIDVASEGTAMTAANLTINNQGSDTLRTELDLFTQNEFALWEGSTPTVYPAPSSLLTNNDFQFLDVEADGQTTARFAQTEFDGSQTTFDLPAVLTGIVFGPAKASWGTLAAYDQATLDMRQPGTITIEQAIVATKGWIDATHATQLVFDANPPGFDASWSINTSTSYQAVFETIQSQGMITTGSVVFDGAPLQRTAKRPWFSTVARVRESMRSQHTMPRR